MARFLINSRKLHQNSKGAQVLPAIMSVWLSNYNNILHIFLSINTNTVEVTSFQAIFPDLNKPTNRTYQSILRKYYETDVVQVNYRQTLEAQSHINGYVAKATKGMIDYLVNERDLLDAHLVLISTIFFKGQWKVEQLFNITSDEQSLKHSI